MRLRIDIYDQTGARVGEGPITSATSWQQDHVLDKAGRFSFEMPASDPRASLLVNKRVALAYSGTTLVGGGVIDEIEVDDSGDVPMLRVSGLDLGQELTYQSVGQLTLAGSGWVRPVLVLRLEGQYTSPPTYHVTHFYNAFDGNGATSDYFTGGGINDQYLYVGAGQPFSSVAFTLEGDGGSNGALLGQYFNGSTWVDLPDLVDGTAVGGLPFQQSGTISWTLPSDMTQTTEGGVSGYYVRLRPAVYANAYFIDTLVDGQVALDAALAQIAAKFPPGWSLDTVRGAGATAHTVYARLDGENVLEALVKLTELTGEHFYVTPDRKVVWLQGIAAGSLRAASGGTTAGRAINPDVLQITKLSRRTESYETATRIYPIGAGLGSARLTLANATDSPPAGYVLNKAENYVKYSAADDVQVIARTVAFKDISALGNDARSHEVASNQLLQSALAWLAQHVGYNVAYDLTVVPRSGIIWPGQTIRVDYRRVVAGYTVLDVHQDLNILGTTTTINESGVWTAKLTVSTTTVMPRTDTELLAGLAKTATTLARYPQPVEVSEVRSTSFGTLGYPLTRGNGGLASTATTAGVVGITGGGLAPHELVGSWHSASGLTAGTYLRASGSASFGFDTIKDGDLPGTLVRTSRQVIAGSGLTGGGALSADVTLNVGAGTLITVAADTVGLSNGTAQYQVPVTGANPYTPAWTALSGFAGAGLTFTGGGFAVGAGSGITVNADDVALTTPGTLSVSSVNSSAGNHTHAVTASSNPGAASALLKTDASGYLQLVCLGIGTAPGYPLHVIGEARLDGDLTFIGAQAVRTTADNLTLAPDGDLTLDPVGNDVLPASNYDLNLGALNKKYLSLHAAELWVETLVAQNTLATLGGRILVGPTTTLTADLAPADTTIYVKHNNLANGDRVYLEANGQVEFMSIDSGPSGTGPYSYTVTRNLDGSGANQWYAGDAVFNTGQTGEGFIDLYSLRGIKSASQVGPTIVGNVRTGNGYADWTEHWAVGNLNGLYGYGADTYGLAAGKYAANQPWLAVDATNGIRMMRGVPGTQLAQWDTSGNILIGQEAAGQSNVLISAGAVKLRNNTTDVITLLASPNAADQIATFEGVVGLGSSGGIYQGSGTFASPTTGLKIYNSGGVGLLELWGGGAKQVYADTDGSLKAAGGAVSVDLTGITMTTSGITQPKLKIINSGSYGDILRFEHDTSTWLVDWNGGAVGGVFRLYGNNSEIRLADTSGLIRFGTGAIRGQACIDGSNGYACFGYGWQPSNPLEVVIAGSYRFKVDSVGNLTTIGGLNVGSATGAATGDGLFSGKVGVGTNSPARKLHVAGATPSASVAQLQNVGYSTAILTDESNTPGLALVYSSEPVVNTVIGRILFGSCTNSGNAQPGASIDAIRKESASVFGGADLAISTVSVGSVTLTERMRVSSNGNVLIGTTTDIGQKLYVNGNAYATNLGLYDNGTNRGYFYYDATNHKVGWHDNYNNANYFLY